jgi:zinc transport system ATP-binding protein
MNAPLIKLDNISKYHNTKETLSSVNLTINPGQIITLIGPNGAGKTTLVKVLLNLVEIDKGKVFRSPNLRIGYMPQKLHIDSTLPITLGRFLKLTEKNLEICNDILEEINITHLMKCPLSSLSGGEMQRALLARAILGKPNFLVLDEPVQGVDVAGQEALYKLIDDLHKKLNCAILMVSHDLHLVMSSTNEVLCLNNHVCCHGRPDQVSKNPAFIKLFGENTNTFSTYTHRHNHQHGLHGTVEPNSSSELDKNGCSHD